jgi:hypothetical protein
VSISTEIGTVPNCSFFNRIEPAISLKAPPIHPWELGRIKFTSPPFKLPPSREKPCTSPFDYLGSAASFLPPQVMISPVPVSTYTK